MKTRTHPGILFALLPLVLSLGACGGGSFVITPPPPGFSLSLSRSALPVTVGETSSPVTVSVVGGAGFTGSVSVAILGLPAGATASLPSPFQVTEETSQQVTFSVRTTATPSAYTITFRGTSGSQTHDAPLALWVGPVVRAYQEGSLLVVESSGGDETARVGLESEWGGTVVEASLNGTNVVNRYDTGREVQVAFYDGNAQYDACAGCTGVFGWDPVQGGDRYSHGSPLLDQVLFPDGIYIKTQPYQWYPDDKGGGVGQPVLGDVIVEQWLKAEGYYGRSFSLRYKITHFGADAHANALQEFPAVYVNLGFDRFVYYGGTAPWSNGPLSSTLMPVPPNSIPLLYTSEHWGAFVNDQNFGLTIYVPSQYPYASGASFPGTSGPLGFGTNYFRPDCYFTFGPGSVLEGDIYLTVGDVQAARQVIYDIQAGTCAGNCVPNPSITRPPDIFTPFGYVDAPSPNNTVSGVVDVAGWTFDDTAVSTVEVLVDGLLAGTATYGLSRPDIPAAFPHAPENVGFQYSLNTAFYANGSHLIQVRVTDTSGNIAVFRKVPVIISN